MSRIIIVGPMSVNKTYTRVDNHEELAAVVGAEKADEVEQYVSTLTLPPYAFVAYAKLDGSDDILISFLTDPPHPDKGVFFKENTLAEEARLLEIDTLIAEEKYTEAETLCLEYIKRLGDQPTFYYRLGKIYGKGAMNRPEDSVKAFDKAKG